jgi:hypothetical protein
MRVKRPDSRQAAAANFFLGRAMHSIGIDFGANCVRALIVRRSDGAE